MKTIRLMTNPGYPGVEKADLGTVSLADYDPAKHANQWAVPVTGVMNNDELEQAFKAGDMKTFGDFLAIGVGTTGGRTYEEVNDVQKDDELTDDELADIEKSVQYEFTGEIAKMDEEKQQVFGWAYVTHDKDGTLVIDKSGEFVDDPGELENTAYSFVVKSRAGDLDHTNVQSATMIESMVFTPEKIEKMGLPNGSVPVGWWVGFHVPEKDDWERVKTRKSFSVHGRGVKKAVE
jgi:hypothetical protein